MVAGSSFYEVFLWPAAGLSMAMSHTVFRSSVKSFYARPTFFYEVLCMGARFSVNPRRSMNPSLSMTASFFMTPSFFYDRETFYDRGTFYEPEPLYEPQVFL
jgi:hypothetical protein